MRTAVVDGSGASAHQTAVATDGRDGSQRCANCGALGLRTVALICPNWDCGEAILDDTTPPEADLQSEAAREFTCLRCGVSAAPIEVLECRGCSDPRRGDGAANALLHGGEADDHIRGKTAADPQDREIIIDEGFAKLIPPLSKEEFALLERHLLTEGCRDPLLVWDDGQRQILLDGYNRLEICRRHGLLYAVQTIELQGRDAALLWILEHQLGRRNLTPEAQAYLLGKLYKGKKSQGDRTDLAAGHSDQMLTAAEHLAAEHHVGEKTIRRHARFAEQLDQLAEAVGPDIKHAVLARDAKITRTDVGRLLKLDSPARDRMIARVRQGEVAADLIREARQKAGIADGPPASAVAALAPESGAIVDGDDGAETAAAEVELRGFGAGEVPVTPAMTQDPAELVRDIDTAIWLAAGITKFLLDLAQGSVAPNLADCLHDRLAGAVLACARHRTRGGLE